MSRDGWGRKTEERAGNGDGHSGPQQGGRRVLRGKEEVRGNLKRIEGGGGGCDKLRGWSYAYNQKEKEVVSPV